MNCGCILKGDPFDGHQTILEACVLHLAWAGEKVKEKELQSQEYKDAADLWGTRWSRLKGNFDKLEVQIRDLKDKAGQAVNWLHALADMSSRRDEVRRLADQLCDLVKGKATEKGAPLVKFTLLADGNYMVNGQGPFKLKTGDVIEANAEKWNEATPTCRVSWPGCKMDDSDRQFCGRPLPCLTHGTGLDKKREDPPDH